MVTIHKPSRREKVIYISFSLLGCIVVIWNLLNPGFLLTLDWAIGKYPALPYTYFSHIVHYPTNLVTYILSIILSSWLIQKFILVTIIFSLFLVPLVYFPWKQYRLAPYFAAIFAAINPFVYERLLAGQWRVLAGYVCLFPLFYYLFQFCRSNSLRHALAVFGTLLFTGFWSVHFLAIGIVITFVTLTAHFGKQVFNSGVRSVYGGTKNVLIAGCLFILLSLYWIVPLAILGSTQLENFTSDDYSAFSTTRDPQVGVVLNVLTLRGFWATGEAWGEQFKLPGDNPSVFYPGIAALMALAIFGWFVLRRDAGLKFERYVFLALFVIATIFATGVSAYGLWQINYWLLETMPFWNGFRDAQKWAGVLAAIYALLAGVGIATLIAKYPRFKFSIGSIAVLIALAISPYQLYGLSGQVAPVWYPAEWAEVDEILQKESDCTAVFLPWHQYYAVKWNNGQLVGNPAARAFSCMVFTSQNTELGDVTLSGNKSEREQAIETAVMNNREDEASIAEGIKLLRESGITHIIYTNDIEGRDIYLYPLLGSPELSRIYDSPTIQLYKIN